MDAVTYLRTQQRMCSTYPKCKDCPMVYESKYSASCSQSQIEIDFPEKAVEIVKKWSEEHPKKTLLTEFLEKYPNANLDFNGIPMICARHLDTTRNVTCDSRCAACWNEPLED